MKIDKVYSSTYDETRIVRPLFSSAVPAGFPSPAEDYIESNLDLNTMLITNPPATYFVRVSGDSMQGASIFAGDILVVDRSLSPRSGKIIIAILDGELTVKRLKIKAGFPHLYAENSNYESIAVAPESCFEVWGVVTYVIHQAL